jgi:hypothetical protein
MLQTSLPPNEQWDDLLHSLEFVERRFVAWEGQKSISPSALESIKSLCAARRQKWSAARNEGLAVPTETGLPEGSVGESPTVHSLRYWRFAEEEVRCFAAEGLLTLAESHDLLSEIHEHQAMLERRLAPEEQSETQFASSGESGGDAFESPQGRPASQPRRNLLEILLDPRSIQMLLAFGGALMVAGLVIWLWVNEYFTPTTVALSLGAGNAVLLAAGWWMLLRTRYQLAGRALTLFACLVMPLNLWYYHTNHLITLDGHLWVAALAISSLYAASALVLRDDVFVYIFTAGVTMTGLLALADMPPSPQKFWEIASPATLLVVLGLLAIHVERAFPEQEGPFGRRRFGLAFFWSGHVLLAAGLLLVLGAEIAGDWFYRPFFERLYRQWEASPSPIVNELRWLALSLVVAGTYAYIYSDVVVRHVGIYVHIAAGTLMWSLVLGLQLLDVNLGLDALIAILSLTSLVVNVAQATALRDSQYTKALPVLGVLLPLLAVALGLVVYIRAISPDLKSVWQTEPPAWTYVGAMALTAVSCRVGAHLYRFSNPMLAKVYFFAAATATLVGATAFLTALGLDTWQAHAPWLMLLPIAYMIAARLYRGRPEEQAAVWVSHAATAVMLASSLASAVEGFAFVTEQPLNLILALFFAEATAFYLLASILCRQAWAIHLAAATACGAVWQLLTYQGVPAEIYTLTFALVGVAFLVVYRFAVLERFAARPVADAAFRSANTLLSLSFVAAIFLGLSRLAAKEIHWANVGLLACLTAMSLLAVALVRHTAWRRWYVVTAIGQAGLAFLGVTVLSELTQWQKIEIFSVSVGVLLLVVGHIGWYREQERQRDLVTLSLLLGSLLAGIPLAVATLIDRSRDHFVFLNELGFLAVAVLLVTTGFLFQLKSTTLVGAGLTALYFVSLLIFVPWSRLNAIAIFIMVGGGSLFVLGLILSVYRDRLLTLPNRIKQRQGIFRVLNWR